MTALMSMRTKLRKSLMGMRIAYLRRICGCHIGKDCVISFKARVDATNPRGVIIGDYVSVALDAVILTHDFLRNQHLDTHIGSRCAIGARAIVGPGVTIGDGTIIGPGAAVFNDIPAGCVVMGNPGRIVEKDIKVGKWGVRIDRIPPERIDPNVVI